MISGRRLIAASTVHLSLDDHMHDFDAAQQDARTAKILESEHGSRASLDRPVILFNDVVEILRLANLDRRLESGVDRVERRQIGAASVNGHGLG